MTKFSFILCDPIESFGNLDEFAVVLRALKNLGFQGVEFNIKSPGLPDADGLRRMVEQIELPVVSFLTGANYFAHGLCLSSPHDEIRQRAVEALCQFTVTAAEFGAVLVVGQMQGFRSDEPDGAIAANRIESALRQVALAAESNQATVVLEPVNHLQCGFHHTLIDVMKLTGRVGSVRLKPMLDSFHMNIEERSMREPILAAGGKLGHFHLCETNGAALGSGHLDVGSILEDLDSIDYSGFVSVKAYRDPWEPAARMSINFLKTIGRV